MDLSQFDVTHLILAVFLILLLVAQNWLIKRDRAWLGIFVPMAYMSLLVYLGATDRVVSLVDFVFAAVGLLGLLAWWVSAREARRQEFQEDERFVITPWTAADSSVSFPPPGTGVRRHTHLRVG